MIVKVRAVLLAAVLAGTVLGLAGDRGTDQLVRIGSDPEITLYP